DGWHQDYSSRLVLMGGGNRRGAKVEVGVETWPCHPKVKGSEVLSTPQIQVVVNTLMFSSLSWAFFAGLGSLDTFERQIRGSVGMYATMDWRRYSETEASSLSL
ncbi:hypothetical protein PIB30_093834, partial [Stylosanthes scabra]|nr:hypothetical protein [Stylosanthes scabra]